MVLLESATPQNACQLEKGWEKALAPTTNHVAPKMDFANILWETIFNKTLCPGKCCDTATAMDIVLTVRHNVFSADILCHLLMVFKGYPDASPFGKLRRFCAKRVKEQHALVLPRTLTLPLPPVCGPAKQAVLQMVAGLVGRSGLPLHVRYLLNSIVMCPRNSK